MSEQIKKFNSVVRVDYAINESGFGSIKTMQMRYPNTLNLIDYKEYENLKEMADKMAVALPCACEHYDIDELANELCDNCRLVQKYCRLVRGK